MIAQAPKIDWLLDDMELDDDVKRRFVELHEREVQNAWAALLDTPGGRLIAWTILDKCHVFASTYTGNAASNFLEGERSVGLKLMKEHILPFGPHTLADMMVEADERFERLMATAMAEVEGREESDG